MQCDATAVQSEFAAFLEALGTGRTYRQALVSRIRDLFSWLMCQGLEPAAIEEPETVARYEAERGIHETRHAEQQISRIRRFLLYRNIIGGSPGDKAEKQGELADVAGRFLLSLENAGYRDATLKRYYYALADLLRFAAGLGVREFSGLSKKMLQDYTSLVVSQALVKRTPAVMAQLIGSVKKFTRYALEEGYLLRDPMCRMRLPRQGKVISRNFLTKDELVVFFAAIDTTTLAGFTDRVLFELLYGAGLRVSEARKARVEDVLFSEGLLRVKDGKGGKDRMVPLPEMTLALVRRYLQHVRPELLARYNFTSDFLFPNSRGNTLSEDWINHWLRFYAKRAGITRHLSSHCLRYSYATHLLGAGIDMRQLAELMGHESLDTTAGYTKVLTNDLKEELTRHHPRGDAALPILRFRGSV
jgi:integrase/recombinase XerD